MASDLLAEYAETHGIKLEELVERIQEKCRKTVVNGYHFEILECVIGLSGWDLD